MSHPLFGPEVRLMLQEGDAAEMKTFCETLHPATVAETLTGDFEPDEVWKVLGSTSIRDQADIFEYFPIDTQVKLVEGTGRPHMARLIEQMSHADRSRLLRRLPPRASEATRKLLGVVGLRDLILAPRTAAVRDLMNEEAQTLRATDDRERAAKELARYDFLAMPVVDDDGRLVGIVTHDDVIDVVVQEATEDAHMMGAVAPLAENYLDAPFVTIWRKRAFWLACLFGAELFTFTALSHFEDEIGKLVVLSLFVPLCISTGGNYGSQAATLITRAMALGPLNLRS